MIKRSLYYWSKLYEEQLSEGDKYETLSRTVCINILDFKYLDNDRFHNGYSGDSFYRDSKASRSR